MPRREHVFHMIYKTTNLVNQKFYIGMHSTSNLNDGYIGSGKKIRNSIKKYGKENFKFEAIEWYPDRISLRNREKELVNDDLLKDPLCMNLQNGGSGWRYAELHPNFGKKVSLSQETRIKISLALKGRKKSDETKAKISSTKIGHDVCDETKFKLSTKNKGKKIWSDEQKQKISKQQKGRKKSQQEIDNWKLARHKRLNGQLNEQSRNN